MSALLMTSSRAKTARACRRKHRIQYTLGYRTIAVAEPLRFGTLIHDRGLAPWFQMPAEFRLGAALESLRTADADEFDRAKAIEMVRGYDARWNLEEWEVLGVELPFNTELRNPLTGRPSKTWRLAGKIDALVRDLRNGLVYTVEHKTSAEDITPGSKYWKRLRMDGQVSIYFEGARSLGFDAAGCIYDVLGKPQLRPYEPGKKREKAETAAEYQARICEAIAADPRRYYQRGEVVRLESEMKDALFDVWQLAQELTDAERLGRAPRNPDSCDDHFQECPFFDVCTGTASLEDPTRFKRLEWVHPELERPKEEARNDSTSETSTH